MIARVSRLVAAEFIKLFSQAFLYIALGMIVLTTLAGAWLGPLLGQKATIWRPYHSIQLFSHGFSWGIRIAGFVLVIFSGMMVSGEFDRGTIKNLLTRPITRTDFFAAKGVTVLLLGIGLYLFTLTVALAYGLGRGDLGDVWHPEQYVIQRPYQLIALIARKAVVMSFVPFLAAGFLGLLISTLTESSGYAVAIALVLFLFGGFLTGMLPISSQRLSFLYYGPYVLEKLRVYSEGGQEYWEESLESRLLYLKVPLAYMAAFLPAAYGVFVRRNVTA